MLTFCRIEAGSGEIDTVLVCMVDMQGRLMGKRFHVQNFIESGHEETHCCNYLLATDLEMATPDGYASTSWQAGYGDYVMKPDLSTLRPVPWLEGTAMVLCDLIDHHTHKPVPHAPRQILKTQIARAEGHGLHAMMATELEFFLFEKSFDEIASRAFAIWRRSAGYNEDYHILQTTKEEAVMRPIRNGLFAAGVPVENSKGEAEAGQEELNIRYAEALMAPTITRSPSMRSRKSPGQQGPRGNVPAEMAPDKVGVVACAPVAVEGRARPSTIPRRQRHVGNDAPVSWPA
jgi:glutamine synthetase